MLHAVGGCGLTRHSPGEPPDQREAGAPRVVRQVALMKQTRKLGDQASSIALRRHL